jgi:hypothetical protein
MPKKGWNIKLSPEDVETKAVADWLRAHGIFFIHIGNEGKSHAISGIIKNMLGRRAGAPDLMIFDAPPNILQRGYSGTAIEMKRPKPEGRKPTQSQLDFLRELEDRMWKVRVCYGADEAIKYLTEMGYSALERKENNAVCEKLDPTKG